MTSPLKTSLRMQTPIKKTIAYVTAKNKIKTYDTNYF
jgi:hypothetical protein